jgi:hypothetical protein
MTNSWDNNKRLDRLELELNPKQWAIKLADEMRRFPSRKDLLKSVARGTYQQSTLARPFYALAEQARERSPKGAAEIKLNRKLRSEFHALKALINDANDNMEINSRANRGKTAVQLFRLNSLILQDALSRTGGAEHMSGSSARLQHSSELNDCAGCLAALWIETAAYKAAVRIIQEKYFESHAILFNDIEMSSEKAMHMLRDVIKRFNEYNELRADLFLRETNHGKRKRRKAHVKRDRALRIDTKEIEEPAEMLGHYLAQKWAEDATFSSTAWILREAGAHEDFIWARLRQEVGLES